MKAGSSLSCTAFEPGRHSLYGIFLLRPAIKKRDTHTAQRVTSRLTERGGLMAVALQAPPVFPRSFFVAPVSPSRAHAHMHVPALSGTVGGKREVEVRTLADVERREM